MQFQSSSIVVHLRLMTSGPAAPGCEIPRLKTGFYWGLIVHTDRDFPRAAGDSNDPDLAARPTNPKLGWLTGFAHDHRCAILRPVTGTGVNFTRGSAPIRVEQAHRRANGERIAQWSPQADAQ